jgi:hypothetical protein
MAAITQHEKDTAIKDLKYLIQVLEAYGLDPDWSSAHASKTPGLNYDVEKTKIAAAGVEMAAIFSTWTT